MSFLLLTVHFLLLPFDASYNYNYITSFERLPIHTDELITFRAKMNYGAKFGVSFDALYISLDASSPIGKASIGVLSSEIGPFYWIEKNITSAILSTGILRIDAAGAGRGSFLGFEFRETFDIEKMGIYFRVSPSFEGTDFISINGFVTGGLLWKGILAEYGVGVKFIPTRFPIFLCLNLSFMELIAPTEEFPVFLQLRMYGVEIGCEI